MNKGQNVRRGRTRHTPKQGGSNSNNGTGNRVDSKSRGNPKQNLDKYIGMARDARQAGDRVNEEYFLQFAEHFQRVINDRNQESEDRRERSNNNNRARQQKEPRNNDNAEAKSVDPANAEQPAVIDQAGEKSAQAKPAVSDEDTPKRRPARKRQPRAKKVEKPAEDSADSPAKETTPAAPEGASPELPLSNKGEAAE